MNKKESLLDVWKKQYEDEIARLNQIIKEINVKNVDYERLNEQQVIITQLTNNWNELEQWCKNNLGYYGSDIGIVYKYVLDKIKELKDGNNE